MGLLVLVSCVFVVSSISKDTYLAGLSCRFVELVERQSMGADFENQSCIITNPMTYQNESLMS